MTEDASDPTDGERADAETEEATDASAGAEAAASETEAASNASTNGQTGDPLVARAAEYDEELAEDVAALRGRADELEAELAAAEEENEELSNRLKRTQADFQNYKKRAKKRQDQIRETATEDFVERVVTVRDNLLRALDQEEGADIRPGIESTLEEFDRILSSEGVSTIDPDPGEEVDPTRHEVMMRVDSGQPEGTVADVYQAGYEMGEKVIRAAQVTVSTGGGE
ncbi:nucleotide exchange factor GrpE [Halogeometricum sp. S1BR25-6]|uniref:Protein GrpE n=1 Tax=Halogeometricum salsisoli TaxID=2950536 RepID=A0ABU2GDL8_9EURY|nr:nucleotide exchange factor GrpE [Halogeometricum sp. S1BR25-6]MDS0298910.1 nucleotide exchange factor GrpE [Halogeometricum sp. S1BR25-6]